MRFINQKYLIFSQKWEFVLNKEAIIRNFRGWFEVAANQNADVLLTMPMTNFINPSVSKSQILIPD
jgi:hypothetical protein